MVKVNNSKYSYFEYHEQNSGYWQHLYGTNHWTNIVAVYRWWSSELLYCILFLLYASIPFGAYHFLRNIWPPFSVVQWKGYFLQNIDIHPKYCMVQKPTGPSSVFTKLWLWLCVLVLYCDCILDWTCFCYPLVHRFQSMHFEIWGSHGGEYEDDCLLGCCNL
jgi:hypothetical protein